MIKETGGYGDFASVTLNANTASNETVGIEGSYHAICRDKDGNIKWEDKFPNLVVAAGKQLMLDTLLRTTSPSTYQTVGPFLGLTNASLTPAASDTMTTLVGGGKEFTSYTFGGSGVRATLSFNAATSSGSTPSNVSNALANAVTFTITNTGTVYGCFLVTGTGAVSTFSSTAGTLYSEGNFATSKSVSNGDTIAVTYSTTATS